MQELHVVAWISFVNGNDVRREIVERREPFVLLLLRPVVLDRRHVIIRLGCSRVSNAPGVSIEAKLVARRYCGVSLTCARTSDGTVTI